MNTDTNPLPDAPEQKHKSKWRTWLDRLFNRKLAMEMQRREDHRTAIAMDVATERRLRRLQYELQELRVSRRSDTGGR